MEKKKIVKILLRKQNNYNDTKELLNLLMNEPTILNVDREYKIKFGDKVADLFTNIIGSWTFIIIFTLFLISWVLLNIFVLRFDSYPFILLNLLLSCVASLQAPIIMMSQNRQAKKDSLRSLNDYKIDLKSELILEEIYKKIEELTKKDKN